MYGVIFSRHPSKFSFAVESFAREGIRLEVINPISDFRERNIIYSSSIFFFHGSLSKLDHELLKMIQLLKPASCTILLEPTDVEDSGFVDFTAQKPFSYAYMSVMIQRKICQKREEAKSEILKYGGMKLHITTRVLKIGRHQVILRNKEFALVRYFFLNPGRIVTRSDLLESVWDRNSTISTNTIDVHVSRLRHKLRRCRANRYLKTIPCLGYQWLVGVT